MHFAFPKMNILLKKYLTKRKIHKMTEEFRASFTITKSKMGDNSILRSLC